MSQSRTDVADITLISLEVVIPGAMVDQMARKLKRIIGVLDVTVSFGALLNCAVYRLLPVALDPALCRLLSGYQAAIIGQQADGHLLIQQIGQENEIQRLYSGLDGPALVGFSKTPLAISQPLNWEELHMAISGASINHP